jgi:hypothetical protein
VFAQVADQADDVFGDQPSDGAAGIDADHDPAAWVEHEAGRLQVYRVVVDEGAGGGGDGAGGGAVTDGEFQAMLGDQVPGGGLVVDRQRDDQGVQVGEAVQRPLERAQLGVTVRAP